MTRALAVVIVAMIATSGCAWRSDVKRLRAEVQQFAESVNRLEAQPAPPTASSVDALAAKLTAANTQVGLLERQLREAGAHIARIETRVVGAERTAQDATARLEALSSTVTRLDAAVPHSPPPAPAVSSPAPVVSPPAVVVVPRPAPTTVVPAPGQIYAGALKMFRAREHGQAVLDFLDFLARYPNHALAPSAQYWIAEAYYLQKDYRQALLEFEKVLAYGPRNPRMADALLRAGMASNQVRDAERAEQHWRRVVEQYPNSDAAQKARGFLSGIGGSRPAR